MSTHAADSGVPVSTLAPVVALAAKIGGRVYRDEIITDRAVVSCTPWGRVYVIREALGMTYLGSWRDGADVLAAAYESAVA